MEARRRQITEEQMNAPFLREYNMIKRIWLQRSRADIDQHHPTGARKKRENNIK
jgi:hypothetical protein